MKISYQQICILLLCVSQSISAITLYNKSNTTIRFNIFKKDYLQQFYNIDPLPKSFGKIAPQSYKKTKKLDPSCEYTVTFYDVYNAQNNKVITIKGDQKIIIYPRD